MNRYRANPFVVMLTVVLVLLVGFVIYLRGHKSSIQEPPGSRRGTIAPVVSFTDAQGQPVSPVCHEGSEQSFHIHGSGMTFNGTAQYVVIYPENSPEHGAPYTYITDNGRVTLDANGSFTTKNTWQCWQAPDGGVDPLHVYHIMVIDETWPDKWFASDVLPFKVVQ